MHTTIKRTRIVTVGTTVAAAAAAALFASTATTASATVVPGTAGNDVTVGLDNDNAQNRFIQPLGVVAKQHMEDTDVLLGREGDDLLVGKKGSDTLLGGYGSDILIGGPEGGQAPNSDVLVGEQGHDINIWAPGDGSDAYLGQEGYDQMIFAPFVKNSNGSLRYEWRGGRWVPRVKIDGLPQFSCTIVRVPPTQRLGFQFLVRFNVNGVPAVTVRQKDVERVLCPSPYAGYVKVADLTATYPAFRNVPLRAIGGAAGAIIAPVS